MNALIIDDNAKTAAGLEELLAAQPGVDAVFTAVQPYLVRSLLASERVDVVFVRVRLWDFRLFENSRNTMPVIVFLSGGRDKLTMQEAGAVRYALREPYHPVHIVQLLKNIRQSSFTEAPDYLFLRYQGRFHRVYFRDIELVEKKAGSYVQFFLREASPLLPGTITYWMRQLPADRFVRLADGLIIPAQETVQVGSDYYHYKGRAIGLTFRFAARAKKEMADWPHGL